MHAYREMGGGKGRSGVILNLQDMSLKTDLHLKTSFMAAGDNLANPSQFLWLKKPGIV